MPGAMMTRSVDVYVQAHEKKTLVAVGQMTSVADKNANFEVCSRLAKVCRRSCCSLVRLFP